MSIFNSSEETYRKRIFWQNHLEEYRKSGLSQREYCKKEGLCLSSLGNWKRKLTKPGMKEYPFVEIGQAVEGKKKSVVIEIIITEKLRLRTDEDVNPEKIALLVNALKGAA
jgi:hypothetical protein